MTDRPKRESLSHEEAMISNMWEIAGNRGTVELMHVDGHLMNE